MHPDVIKALGLEEPSEQEYLEAIRKRVGELDGLRPSIKWCFYHQGHDCKQLFSGYFDTKEEAELASTDVIYWKPTDAQPIEKKPDLPDYTRPKRCCCCGIQADPHTMDRLPRGTEFHLQA